jgi:hypothetical protein
MKYERTAPKMRRHPADGQGFLREQVESLKSAGWVAHAKEFERAITALQVIHTWANFDKGSCLKAGDVARLTTRALKGFITSNPRKATPA